MAASFAPAQIFSPKPATPQKPIPVLQPPQGGFVYPQHETLTFSVEDAAGNVVSSSVVPVTATRTTPLTGDQADDANDKGAMFPLKLAIPTPGNYRIRMEYGDDASVFRSNSGVSGLSEMMSRSVPDTMSSGYSTGVA